MEFNWLTPAELHFIIDEFRKNRENEMHHDYEVARFTSWISVSPHVKSGINNPQKLVKFDWEKPKGKADVKIWHPDQPNTKS